MSSIVSQRYAKAIFNLALENKNLDNIHRDISKIGNLFETSDDFVTFVNDPAIDQQKRRKIIALIFQGKIDSLTNNFLYLINEKDRLKILKIICIEFNNLFLNYKDTKRIKVTTSMPLNENQIHTINTHFKEKLKKTIEIESSLDQSIIGGLKVQVDDTVFDYSIKTQLETFKENTLKA